jgi:alpha-methylacyl-CoA racemase
VLVEGFRPGVAERLGIAPDVCCTRNPRLVYARMTGWGQTGPLAPLAGHDLNYIARSGALNNIGRPGSPPPPPQAYIGDFGGGGTFLAMGVLAALYERQRSGRGQVVDAAVVDGAASLTTFSHGLLQARAWSDERGTTIADGSVPYYDTYETADGRYVTVAALEPAFYSALLKQLGLRETDFPHGDRAVWPALRERLAKVFASRTRDEWVAVFDGVDACFAPVLTLTEATRDPHNVARGVFTTVGDHLEPAPAPRFGRTPSRAGGAAPAPGDHSGEILRELGFSAEQAEELLAVGAVGRQAS